MGIHAEVEKGDWETIISKLMGMGISDRETLEKILLGFGEHIGEYYIILNNEFYEDFNSYYGVSVLLDKHFGLEDTFDVFLHECTVMVCNSNEMEVADNLGLDIDWDGEVDGI